MRILLTQEFGIEEHPGENPYDAVSHATFSLDFDDQDVQGLSAEQQHLVQRTPEGMEAVVGHLSFAVVDGYDPNWLDALDALSSDFHKVASTFWSKAPNDFGMHLSADIEPDTAGSTQLMVIDSLTIAKPFRGRRLGLLGLGAVMQRMSNGCAYAFGYPMMPGAQALKERASAAQALTHYYEELGFQTFHDCIYINFAYERYQRAWRKLVKSYRIQELG